MHKQRAYTTFKSNEIKKNFIIRKKTRQLIINQRNAI